MIHHSGTAFSRNIHPSLHRLVARAREFAGHEFVNSRPMPMCLMIETPNGIFEYARPRPRHNFGGLVDAIFATTDAAKEFAAAFRASGIAVIYELFGPSESDGRRKRGKRIPREGGPWEAVCLLAESHGGWTNMVFEVLRTASGRFSRLRECEWTTRNKPSFGLLDAKSPNAEERTGALRTLRLMGFTHAELKPAIDEFRGLRGAPSSYQQMSR